MEEHKKIPPMHASDNEEIHEWWTIPQTDREFLMWIYERFYYKYNESACYNWMHKLKKISEVIPKDQITD